MGFFHWVFLDASLWCSILGLPINRAGAAWMQLWRQAKSLESLSSGGSSQNHREKQDMLSWKAPTGIIEFSIQPCTGHPHESRLVLQSIVQTPLELCQVWCPQHPRWGCPSTKQFGTNPSLVWLLMLGLMQSKTQLALNDHSQIVLSAFKQQKIFTQQKNFIFVSILLKCQNSPSIWNISNVDQLCWAWSATERTDHLPLLYLVMENKSRKARQITYIQVFTYCKKKYYICI